MMRHLDADCMFGGGPAGLYFAISMKLRDPSHDIVVIERNKPDDTFGWGVVLSMKRLTILPPMIRSAQRPSAPILLLG